jgi:outer membrane protein assembly factor BamB
MISALNEGSMNNNASMKKTASLTKTGYIHAVILFMFYIFLVLPLNSADAGSTWMIFSEPQPSSESGIYETKLQYTTWETAIGAYSLAVHYNPSALEIVRVTIPDNSEFFGKTSVDESSFRSGSTSIAAYQISNYSDRTSPETFATIFWKPIGSFGGSTNIQIEARSVVDALWRPVDVITSGVSFSSIPLRLMNPSDNQEFTACSYTIPPIFQWNTTESFKSIEVQFSKNNFINISLKSKVKPGIGSLAIKAASWKKILLLPGPQGGIVYWRVVGTKKDKTTMYSNILSLAVKGAAPVGNPTITPTNKTAFPILSWQNNCNTKFKIWFGNSSSFTKKKSLSFSVKNPADNGGLFTRTLTSAQWTSIRKLVGDVGGATIYWYVEAQDVLKRISKTEIKGFVLEPSSGLASLNLHNKNSEASTVDDEEIWPMFGHDAQHTGRSSYRGPSVTPTLQWTSSLLDGNYSQIVLGSSADLIYGVGSYDDEEHNSILWINTITGLVSKYTTDYGIHITPAIDRDGSLYFGDNDGNIYALNPDFDLKWKKKGYFGKNNHLNAPPTIGPDGNIYMVGNDSLIQNPLICVTPDGSMKWRYKSSNASVASLSPAIGKDGTVYVSVEGGNENRQSGLVALHPDGTFKWKYTVGDTPALSPAIGPDNTIYFGTNQYLYAVNPDGSLKWITGGAEYELSVPAIGADGTIYIDLGGNLSAIRPEDGSIKWTFNLIFNASYVTNKNSIAIDSIGTVYVGSQDYLHAVNPDGSVKWQYYDPNALFMSPIIGHDDTIYVQHDDKVSALSE